MVNNVTRMLDGKKVGYQVFELPEEKLGAVESARLMNVPVGHVFKTIVVTQASPGKPILAVIPGDCQLDLKLLASLLGLKKVSLPTEKEAERLTGLQAGGISPLALVNKGFVVVIDAQAEEIGVVHVSGGQRGLNIRLKTNDLAYLSKARIGRISVRVEGREEAEG